MIMHHLMKQGFSFHPLIYPLVQVQRHAICRLRVRPQEFPIELRLELPKIEPIRSYTATSLNLRYH